MLALLELPPEIMPLLALLGPVVVVLVTLATSPRVPTEETRADEPRD